MRRPRSTSPTRSIGGATARRRGAVGAGLARARRPRAPACGAPLALPSRGRAAVHRCAWTRRCARSSRRRPTTSPPCNGASTPCAAIGTGLFLTAGVLPAMGEPLDWRRWRPSRALALGAGLGRAALGRCAWEGSIPTRLPARVSVRRRRGGETLKPAARARTQSVQHLCQRGRAALAARRAAPDVCRGNADRGRRSLAGGARERRARHGGLGCEWEERPPLT